jgi:hypothetical protein
VSKCLLVNEFVAQRNIKSKSPVVNTRVNKIGFYHNSQSGIQISNRNLELDRLLSSEVPVYLGHSELSISEFQMGTSEFRSWRFGIGTVCGELDLF